MSLVANAKEKATATAKVETVLGDLTIGQKIDKLHEVREKIRKLEATVKELEGTYDGIETALMEQLSSQGIDASRGTKAGCSITKTVVAQVVDWDAFYAFIKKTGYFHLLQKRVSDPSFRELLEQKGEATVRKHGVEPFTKKRLNLRAI